MTGKNLILFKQSGLLYALPPSWPTRIGNLDFLNLFNGPSHEFTWLSPMTSGYGIYPVLLVGIKK